MATNSVGVSFRVAGDDVQQYMESIRRRAQQLTNESVRQAQQLNLSQKEQDKYVRDKINHLQKQLELENKLATIEARANRDSQLSEIAEVHKQNREDINKDFRDKRISQSERDRLLQQNDRESRIDRDAVNKQYRDELDRITQRRKEAGALVGQSKENYDKLLELVQQIVEGLHNGNQDIVNALDADDEDKELAQSMAERQVDELQSQQQREQQNDKNKEQGTFASILNALALQRVLGFGAQMAEAKNPIDLLKPIFSMVGGAVGGLIGNGIDAVAGTKVLGTGLGQTSFGALGTQLGLAAGEFMGAAVARTYKNRDQLTRENLKLQALIGRDIGVDLFGSDTKPSNANGNYGKDNVPTVTPTYIITPSGMRVETPESIAARYNQSTIGGTAATTTPTTQELYDEANIARGTAGTGRSRYTSDFRQYGYDYLETAKLQSKIVTSYADAKSLSDRTESIMAIEKAYGITSDMSLQLVQLLRGFREGNRDVLKLVAGVEKVGREGLFRDDNVFLGEFMTKNFAQLQQTLMSTQNYVASGTTFDILNRFNNVGGPFAARDERSMQLINAIHGSLVNPNSDNMKALSFISLRQNNSSLNLSQLLEEQQKGLASPTYVKTIMSMIDRLGGDDSMRVVNFANAFGLQDNISAARLLYNKRSEITSGQISQRELQNLISGVEKQNVFERGKKNVGEYEKMEASIENEFNKGMTDGLKKVASGLVELFGDMMDEVKTYIRGQMESSFSGSGNPLQTNNVPSGASKGYSVTQIQTGTATGVAPITRPY